MIQQITMQPAGVPQAAKTTQGGNAKSFDSVLQQAVQAAELQKSSEQKLLESGLVDTGALSLFPINFLMNATDNTLFANLGQNQALTGLEGVTSTTGATSGLEALITTLSEGSQNPLLQAFGTEGANQTILGSSQQSDALQQFGELLQLQVKNPASQGNAFTVTPQQTEQGTTPQIPVQIAEQLRTAEGTPQSPAVQSHDGQPAATQQFVVTPQYQQMQGMIGNSNNAGMVTDFSASLSGNTAQTVTKTEQSSFFGENGLGLSQQWQSGISTPTISHTGQSTHVRQSTFTHLTQQVLQNHQVGNTKFQMDLFPKDLGKVSVSIAMEQGVMVVDILAESAKTQSLLLSNSADIRNLLETAVGQPVQMTQSSQQPTDYDSQGDAEQQEQQQQEQQPEENDAQDFLTVLQQLRVKNSMI